MELARVGMARVGMGEAELALGSLLGSLGSMACEVEVLSLTECSVEAHQLALFTRRLPDASPLTSLDLSANCLNSAALSHLLDAACGTPYHRPPPCCAALSFVPLPLRA